MSSLLTNTSAMIALETLRGINRSLSTVQNEIATGKRISSARDNSAIWAISTVMESDVQGFNQIRQSLDLGVSTIAVARAATENVATILNDIKGLIVGAQGDNIDRTKLQADIEAKRDTIASIVASAQFNGLNLINGGTPAPSLTVLTSLNRTGGTVTPVTTVISGQNLSQAAGGGLATLATLSVSTAADAATALTNIETMMQTTVNAGAAFGSAQNRLETQGLAAQKIVDSMKTAIGVLVDADMEAASARLQALQVQKQLGVQALSIANQSPQTLLNLFR
jgi:flagellin